MLLLKALLGGLILIALIRVVAALISVPHNRKRRHIMRVASELTDTQLRDIYALVEQCGTEPPDGAILARTNQIYPDPSCAIPLPSEIPNFAWGGRTVIVRAERQVVFALVEGSENTPHLLGHVYRYVQVPRRRLKSGKLRNVFSPKQYVKVSPRLAALLSEFCPGYASELLTYLLLAGGSTYEFDPAFQARIGTGPTWLQETEFQVCDQCNERMSLIVEVPGTMLHPKNFHEGMFYLFGCTSHPQNTKTVEQYA